ncbi:MAG TPA: hypothetical protein EYN26_08345 [Chromatiales bacterium]|jgi:general secretion pathway protein C|nr:hypothetical protein [Chromatiales bacterium]
MLTAKLPIPTLDLALKALPNLATAIMVVLVVYWLAQTGASIFTDTGEEGEANSNAMLAKPATSVKKSKTPYVHTATLHLFGTAASGNAQVAAKHIDAPDTKLNLTLRGIFSGKESNQGFAIIQANHKKDENFFLAGSQVFGLAKLDEIYPDRVILLHNGKYETLRLPELSLPREHYTNSEASRAEKTRVATDYRNRFLAGDGMDLITLFGFDTAHKDGTFYGFEVRGLGEEGRQMMETLGIKEKDVITVVNGDRLADSLEAVANLKKLKHETSIDIIIERDGGELPFHFDVDPPTIVEYVAPPIMDWNQQPGAAVYQAKQRARTTGANEPVEYDH